MRRPAIVALALASQYASAQVYSQRGFLDTTLFAFPQKAFNDRGRAIGEGLFRYEGTLKPNGAFSFYGAFDARTDTHRQTERAFHNTFWDRTIQRPAFAVRRASAIFAKGPVTLELGKQFVRWGKTDILTPTDRFAPRDYLSVVENEFLAVTGARLTLARDANSLDLVYTARMTPSRTPLLNQRWVVLPPAAAGIALRDAGALYPGGPQFGVRWNRTGSRVEHSLSYFEGFNHLPLFDGAFTPPVLSVFRTYAKIRTIGADVAAPLSWFTVKGEAAYFKSDTRQADEYVLYVLQLERQQGEWLFIGGYAGEQVTERRSPFDFAPDRGLARAFVGRASYTIDTNRSVAFEMVARQNGKGFLGKLEYSHGFGQHWRVIARAVAIRGTESDFLGQYRRNSYASITFRYSF